MGIFNSSFFSSLKKVTKVTNSMQTFECPLFHFNQLLCLCLLIIDFKEHFLSRRHCYSFCIDKFKNNRHATIDK